MFSTRSIPFRALIFKHFKTFTASTQDVQVRLDRITNKAKLKQSVADMKKLQSYLEETKQDKSLGNALSRTAKYDQEFNEFLSQYKEKNKEYANIVDLSHYSGDQNTAKSQQFREEELRMLEEFRQRKQEKTIYINSDEEDAYHDKYKKNTHKTANKADNVDEEEDVMIDPKRFNKQAMAEDARRTEDKLLEERMRSLYDGESFVILLLDRGVTTNVTTLNRVNHFRYLVFMGNANGVIGYGTGKGGNFETALNNAIKDCKKNLIAVPLDHFQTLTTPIETWSNGMRLYLEPRTDMNAWGHPIIAAMLSLAGVSHVAFKINARNKNTYNMVYCMFKALTIMRTPKDLAENMGFKLYHQSYMPWKYYDQHTNLRH